MLNVCTTFAQRPFCLIIIATLESKLCGILYGQTFHWEESETFSAQKRKLPDASWVLQMGIIFSVLCIFKHSRLHSLGIQTSSSEQIEFMMNIGRLLSGQCFVLFDLFSLRAIFPPCSE